jgi:3-hydroxyisobutyrate/3-hydroxypropionate dehydrogenase
MGYPMAKNLLKGLGPEKTLLICDVNNEALERFKKEAEISGAAAKVEVVENGYEAIKGAVRNKNLHSKIVSMIYILPTYLHV